MRFSLTIAVVIWATIVGGATFMFFRYGATPGTQGDAPERWPADAALSRAAGEPVVVMVAHPRCPCTRASVVELTELMKNRALTAYVLFVVPSDVEEGWEKGDLWESAARIPGVVPVVDRGGALARRFGGQTSGDTFIYDERGALVFHGGITGSRGHVGDNIGLRRASALLDHVAIDRGSSPVFGCQVNDKETLAVSP